MKRSTVFGLIAGAVGIPSSPPLDARQEASEISNRRAMIVYLGLEILKLNPKDPRRLKLERDLEALTAAGGGR